MINLRRLRRLVEGRPSVPDRSLGRRTMLLTSITVAVSVIMVGLAAWWITRWSLLEQLDNELIELAAFTSGPISADLENMGGLDSGALRSVNVVLIVLRADGDTQRVEGSNVDLAPGAEELAVARTQSGASARTDTASDGARYRIVAVPLVIDSGQADSNATPVPHNYALVLARSMAPTDAVLASLWIVLVVVGLLGVLLSLISGWLVGRSGLQPLRELSTALQRVTATGALTPIAFHSTDELGELTRSFNTMMNSLRSSQERQRRLIADAGHELRTPLTSTRTNVELLIADEKSDMLPDGARAEILRDVAAQLGEFSSLVGDLVQLSREDKVTASPEAIDFRDIVHSAVVRAKRRGPTINFNVQLEPLFVIGEPDTLERAVTNLLDNAVKFSPPDGTVTVKLEGDLLTVADEGPGIAKEDLAKVFDRFYRSDRARNTPGTGLGLSIVAHTVQAHGGWVEAGGAPGGGAKFTLRLPGQPDPINDDEALSFPAPTAPSGNR